MVQRGNYDSDALQGDPTEAGGTHRNAVGPLFELVGAAFGIKARQVASEIAAMAKSPDGESDPTRETILGYVKEPRETRPRRANRLTPIHHKIAHLVMDYLDGRRADDTSIEIMDSTRNSPAWREAWSLCSEVLVAERDRRYQGVLGHDPGTELAIGQIVGVYAVCRRETRDKKYRQELLILSNVGTKKAPRCYCTYVASTVVTRGEWMLVGKVIYCSMSGYRADNTHELGGMYLAYSKGSEILSGFLAGAGTEEKQPVAMPLAAVKISGVSTDLHRLGDLNDAAVLKLFNGLKVSLTGVENRLHEILSTQMSPIVFEATVCNPDLRSSFDGGRLLIDDRLREFCASFNFPQGGRNEQKSISANSRE